MAEREYQAEIAQLTRRYQPSPATSSLLQAADVVTVGGPDGVGKRTVMAASNLTVVKGWTTQQKLPKTEDFYRPTETAEARFRVLEGLRKGAFVEAAIDQTTGEFRGFRREALNRHGPSLLAAQPKQHDQLVAKRTFGSVRPSYLTAPSYSSWQDRLAKVGYNNRGVYAQQMREAKKSLEEALENDDYYFILNGDVALAATGLRRYALFNERNVRGNIAARRAGQSMLRGLVQSLGR
jgi:guanylate kinase